MKRLPAIPTVYRGIKFRSKLEAKYARAFDILGISWTYEEVNFMFDDGTCYAPDFYLPELDTFFEVKGVMDDASRRKIDLLAKETTLVVVGGPDGKMECRFTWSDAPPADEEDEAVLSRCLACGKTFLLPETGDFTCRACGEYDGDHHLGVWCCNIFDLAFGGGWKWGR